MTTDLTTGNEAIDAFRQKIADRIRDDIGTLMPDEMLQEIVKQTIERELGAPVKKGSGYNASSTTWVEDLVSKQIGDAVRAKAKELLDKREKEITDAMAAQIAEQMPQLLANLFVKLMQGNDWAINNAVQSAFMNASNRY